MHNCQLEQFALNEVKENEINSADHLRQGHRTTALNISLSLDLGESRGSWRAGGQGMAKLSWMGDAVDSEMVRAKSPPGRGKAREGRGPGLQCWTGQDCLIKVFGDCGWQTTIRRG
jgi:hypothetical protein